MYALEQNHLLSSGERGLPVRPVISWPLYLLMYKAQDVTHLNSKPPKSIFSNI